MRYRPTNALISFLLQPASEDHKRWNCWNHWSDMCLPAGFGQDEAAEPADRTQWRTHVQQHVSTT